MAMGTLADLEDQDPILGKESPLEIHLKVSLNMQQVSTRSHSSKTDKMWRNVF